MLGIDVGDVTGAVSTIAALGVGSVVVCRATLEEVELDADAADEAEVDVDSSGLWPPAESTVAPRGMLSCPTGAVVMAVGEEAESAGFAKLPIEVVSQVLEATPAFAGEAMLLPVKRLDNPCAPAEFELIVESGAISELSLAAPWPGQADAVLVLGPPSVGLRPGVGSSVAPSGMPVKPSGAIGPIPSGEVMPSGDGAEEYPGVTICAT